MIVIQGIKKAWSAQPFPLPLSLDPMPHWATGLSFFLPTMNLQKAFLLPFTSLASFNSNWSLAFLCPFLHERATSLHSSHLACPHFYHLCSSFLWFSSVRNSVFIFADLSPHLPDRNKPFVCPEEVVLEDQAAFAFGKNLSKTYMMFDSE